MRAAVIILATATVTMAVAGCGEAEKTYEITKPMVETARAWCAGLGGVESIRVEFLRNGKARVSATCGSPSGPTVSNVVDR